MLGDRVPGEDARPEQPLLLHKKGIGGLCGDSVGNTM